MKNNISCRFRARAPIAPTSILVAALTLAGILSPRIARAELLFDVQLTYEVKVDSIRDRWVAIDAAQLMLEPGMSGSAFICDAGVKLAVATAGDAQQLVDFTLTTLPPAARVVSRQMLIEERRPVEVVGLLYERTREARVRIQVRRTDGTLDCPFGSNKGVRNVDEYLENLPFHGAPSMLNDSIASQDGELWYVDPSAHFEIHYIPNTMGDFGWNSARDFLEKDFQQFDNVFHLYRAQRINYFLAPCKVPEIAWTASRSWAVEPTTFKAYAVYNHDLRGVSGVPTVANYFYRYYGYAPMLVVEGIARGFEYDHFYAKKLKWQRRLPRLSRYWRTLDYKQNPDTALPIAAGSFVSYLISTRGNEKLFRLYDEANDFNVDSVFPAVYGESLGKLEGDWLKFLDTMRIYPHIAGYYAARSKILGRNDESIELLKALIEVDTADVDPYREDLALIYFLEGRYRESIGAIDAMSDRSQRKLRSRHMRNNAFFFDGQLDSAKHYFESTIADSADIPGSTTAQLMYGWMELSLGHYAHADTLLGLVLAGTGPQALDRLEASLRLAQLRRTEGQNEAADSLFRFAIDGSMRHLQDRAGAADLYLRIGEGYVGLGAADTALVYLPVAEFLETRPYYMGRVLVAMGNAYDLLGMRDRAVEYYREVLDRTTCFPAAEAARQYLRTPFRAAGA
jgi:tetratricopeptide (TPR) repeat protein